MAQLLIDRPFRPGDTESILSLVRARPPERILDFPSINDLLELLGIQDRQRMTRIWETLDGQFAGYSLLNCEEEFAALIFDYIPAFVGDCIGERILEWGERTFQQEYHGQAQELVTTTREYNLERIRLLKEHNFQHGPDSVVFMERSLSDSIPEAQIPEGFTLRGLTGESEYPAWVALHRAGFGTENMTIEYRQAMSATPGYDPALDLVAVSPSGELAAYVMCSISAEENALSGVQTGFTDPIATHPTYQRKGLCRALLLTGLRLLKERGMMVARLGTASDNLPMQKTAESVGYQVVGYSWSFVKSLPR